MYIISYIKTTAHNTQSWNYLQHHNKKSKHGTCPSAIINRTWYWPPLCSTMVIAISIIGAKDVGPVQNHLQKDELAHMPNPVKWLNRAIATYQLSANVV